MKEQQLVRVTSVTVLGLLNDFDHRFEFQADWQFLLIFGPNGVGKTKLLELINAVFKNEMGTVAEIPFNHLKIRHDDDTTLDLWRESAVNDDEETNSVRMALRTADRRIFHGEYQQTIPRQTVEFFTHAGWEPIGSNMWRDSSDGEVLHVSELESRYLRAPRPKRRSFTKYDADPELFEFLGAVQVHLIATQRLLFEDRAARSREANFKSTIEKYSRDLKEHLDKALTENSRRTQQLDRSFPKRLLEIRQEDLNPDEIRQRYEEQSRLRQNLAQIGLIGSEVDVPLPEQDLNIWQLNVLRTYLDDTDKKLATFNDVLARVNLFLDIANRRFFHKKIEITTDEGIAISRLSDGKSILPSGLSSGEQHEIVLLYDLLFNVQRGSLVLIDEPEISLHVAWQKNFITDIERIAELASLRFIIATHSPQIINKSWDQTAELSVSEDFWE